MSEKIYRVQMNSKGMPNFSTAEEVDAVSVVHGEWKAKSFHEVYCDNCGFTFDIMKCDFLENMKFCPNCGVRMKGERKGE